MTRDPVCGRPVNENQAAYTSEYAGRIYSFCSEHCWQQFEENPDLYAAQQRGEERAPTAHADRPE
jgi:Cu+-exporting ATPase